MSKPQQTTDEHRHDSGLPEADDVNWPELWDEFGFGSDSIVSSTQLMLMVDVSELTDGATESEAVDLAESAVDDGLLCWEPAKMHSQDGDRQWVTRGYSLPGES